MIKEMGDVKIFMTTPDGEDIEIKGMTSSVEIEETEDQEPHVFTPTYSGTLTLRDTPDMEQLIASITPYSPMFKKIRMPDGQLLTRGKRKWKKRR